MRFPVRIGPQYRTLHLTEFLIMVTEQPHKARPYSSNDDCPFANQRISKATAHMLHRQSGRTLIIKERRNLLWASMTISSVSFTLALQRGTNALVCDLKSGNINPIPFRTALRCYPGA